MSTTSDRTCDHLYDQQTRLNGAWREKGVLNNQISSLIFENWMLRVLRTHFLSNVSLIPNNWIRRLNYSFGGEFFVTWRFFLKTFGVEEGRLENSNRWIFTIKRWFGWPIYQWWAWSSWILPMMSKLLISRKKHVASMNCWKIGLHKLISFDRSNWNLVLIRWQDHLGRWILSR